MPAAPCASCVGRVRESLTGGGRTNTWDSQNRLVQCAYNGTTTTNTYACDGLRHRSVVGANTTDYVLDQSMQVRELLNGTVKATYLVGPRGPEYGRDDQAGAIRWYVYDGLGSVVGEVAPDGTLTRAQSFDVYACVRTSSGMATTKHKFVGALGHPSDDETGLIYMRARHYDPVCGRFVSEDPGRDGANWFAYASDNPVNYVDSSGLDSELPSLMTGMFISGLLFGTMEGFCDWMYQMITKHEVNWSHVFWTSVLFFGLGAALGAGGIAFAGTEAGEAFMALACLLSPRCLVQGILLASEAGKESALPPTTFRRTICRSDSSYQAWITTSGCRPRSRGRSMPKKIACLAAIWVLLVAAGILLGQLANRLAGDASGGTTHVVVVAVGGATGYMLVFAALYRSSRRGKSKDKRPRCPP